MRIRQLAYLALIILSILIVSYLATVKLPTKPKTTTINHPSTNIKSSKKTTTLSHIFIIVEENQPYNNIVGNPNAPYINSLIKKYALATNYHGVTHPSLPNYLALTSGSTDGITTDCNPPSAGCEVNVPNITNEITKSGRTWKEYAESMPSACYAYNALPYATKHNPFLYYKNIINNPSLCLKHVVPFNQLTKDLSSINSTPNYAFITPNQCNDMHSCSISTGDTWLSQQVPLILASSAFTKQNSLLIITWDEGNATTNHIPTILLGNSVKKNYQSAIYYNHYSILHTIEAEWNLAPLTTNDKQATAMTNFLN